MIVNVNGTDIRLNDIDVKLASRTVAEFMDRCFKSSNKVKRPTLYFTILIMMNLQSSHAMDMLDMDTLKKVMNTLNGDYSKKNSGQG